MGEGSNHSVGVPPCPSGRIFFREGQARVGGNGGGGWLLGAETGNRAEEGSKGEQGARVYLHPRHKKQKLSHRKLIDLKVWFPAVLHIKGPRDCAVLSPSSASPINKMPALLERLIPPKKSAYGSTMTR